MATVEIKSTGINKDEIIKIISETKGWEYEISQNFVEAIDKESNLTISGISDDQVQIFVERLKNAGADVSICDENAENHSRQEGNVAEISPNTVKSKETTILVLGIVSLAAFMICIGFIPAIIAIVMGFKEIKRNGKNGKTIAGMVCGTLTIILTVALCIIAGSEISKGSKIDEYISNQQYTEALQYMQENNYTGSDSQYYKIFVGLERYDDAAEIYLKQANKTSDNQKKIDEFEKYKEKIDPIRDKVSDSERERIDEYYQSIEDAKTRIAEAERKAEEERQAEEARKAEEARQAEEEKKKAEEQKAAEEKKAKETAEKKVAEEKNASEGKTANEAAKKKSQKDSEKKTVETKTSESDNKKYNEYDYNWKTYASKDGSYLTITDTVTIVQEDGGKVYTAIDNAKPTFTGDGWNVNGFKIKIKDALNVEISGSDYYDGVYSFVSNETDAEEDTWNQADVAIVISSANELKSFIRQKSNIGKTVRFNATVFNVNGAIPEFGDPGQYCLGLDDGKTAVYGWGLIEGPVVLDGDYVTFTGVYQGTDNPNHNQWPYFTSISIEVNE